MGSDRTIDARLAVHQARQLGLVSWRQAKADEISRKAFRYRIDVGRLVRRQLGVYADPAVPATWEQSVLAAVLACGETAFASHATAARMWGMTWEVADEDLIEVTTVLERDPKLTGVRSHRSGLLLDCDVQDVGGVPVSSPERMVLDLSGRTSVPELARLVDEALYKRITSLSRIAACVDRLPRAPGRSPSTVREVLTTRTGDGEPSESVLESFVLDSLRRHGVPLPEVQVWIELPSGKRRLDQCYIGQRLVVEADGFGSHSTRSAFDDDRVRGNELVLAGYRVLHFTTAFDDWQIAATVAAALGVSAPDRAPEGPRSFKQWFGGRAVAPGSAVSSGGRSGR